MLMKKNLFIFVILACSIPAVAYVYGGTNFGYSGYPDPNCYLFDTSDSYQRDAYVRCINEYVENASNDIKRIKEKAAQAADDAERKLRFGY